AQRDQRRHRQSAARRIAADDDLLRVNALIEQPAITRESVFDRGGEAMFGRETVIEREDAGVRLPRQRRSERAVSFRRTGDVSAAVQVINSLPRLAGGPQPFAFHPSLSYNPHRPPVT